MLRLELLPAGSGDSLWLEYGEGKETRIVLIDGGVRDTVKCLQRRIRAALRQRRASSLHIELLVVTHIDNDHIDGVLELLADRSLPVTFGDIWFNGNAQLAELPEPEPEGRGNLLGADLLPSDILGLQEGDQLSTLLASLRLSWNLTFGGKAAVVRREAPLPVCELPGGLKLTLLGPPMTRLRRLAAEWQKVLGEFERVEQGAVSRPPDDLLGRRDTWPPAWRESKAVDRSVANGSSIALLFEYGDHRLLTTGDAFAGDLAEALRRLATERHDLTTPLPLSAFKLPHHGSAGNLSKKLLEQVKCRDYLISTDGSVHRHPDHLALLRILRYGEPRPRLCFNYDAPTTRDWRDRRQDVLQGGYGAYETDFPENPARGLIVRWE